MLSCQFVYPILLELRGVRRVHLRIEEPPLVAMKTAHSWPRDLPTGCSVALAMIPPDEFEQNYYAQIDASSDDEATSKKTA
jgi:hypothetical protein